MLGKNFRFNPGSTVCKSQDQLKLLPSGLKLKSGISAHIMELPQVNNKFLQPQNEKQTPSVKSLEREAAEMLKVCLALSYGIAVISAQFFHVIFTRVQNYFKLNHRSFERKITF
jgi:hypothetical protein